MTFAGLYFIVALLWITFASYESSYTSSFANQIDTNAFSSGYYLSDNARLSGRQVSYQAGNVFLANLISFVYS